MSKLLLILTGIGLFLQLAPSALQAEIDNVAGIQKFTLKQNKDFNFRYGSSLAFKKASPYAGGILQFYLAPGGELRITDGREERAAKDVPHYAIAKLKKGKLIVKDRFPILFKEDRTALVDLEAIAPAPDGSIWLADEAANQLFNVSTKNGQILQTIDLKDYIGADLERADISRGVESLTVGPDGTLYFALQSPLEAKGEEAFSFYAVSNKDPENIKVRKYLVPVNKAEYQSRLETKFGDLAIVAPGVFIYLEQGLSARGAEQSRIYQIWLPSNQDPTQPLRKSLLVDLVAEGWTYRKAEGLTMTDAATVAVINDWDDGIKPQVKESELWLISLKEPLVEWGWFEYTLAVVLAFIFLISTVITIIMVFGNFQRKLGRKDLRGS